jgi:hypothetical protein
MRSMQYNMDLKCKFECLLGSKTTITNVNGTGRTQDHPDAAACSQQSVIHIPNPDRSSYLQLLYFKHLQLHRKSTTQEAVKCTVL